MNALDLGLLAAAMLVRALLAMKHRQGFALDVLTIPAWLYFYAARGDWLLCLLPLYYGAWDVAALLRWWRPQPTFAEQQQELVATLDQMKDEVGSVIVPALKRAAAAIEAAINPWPPEP